MIGAHDFIAALPEGYDTPVGKRGGRLSAGQRQLISFARAFLAAPAVLVLDEATSLLDIPSERLVQGALRTVLAGRTASSSRTGCPRWRSPTGCSSWTAGGSSRTARRPS
jgi:ABC-type multidrug transport system fused ATPase/permease subunit